VPLNSRGQQVGLLIVRRLLQADRAQVAAGIGDAQLAAAAMLGPPSDS
jgi:hypothetical protein